MDSHTVFIRKLLDGNFIKVDVTRSMRVRQLKSMIQDEEGIAVDQQRLMFAGNQLEDEACLEECLPEDFNDITIHLVLRLKGC